MTVATDFTQPLVNRVTVTPVSATVEQGKTQKFTATVDVANNASEAVDWSISGTSRQGRPFRRMAC